jgi:hypothetical protein
MELKTPLAIANHLLDTSALVAPKTATQDVKEKDDTARSYSSPAASDNVRFQLNIITSQY